MMRVHLPRITKGRPLLQEKTSILVKSLELVSCHSFHKMAQATQAALVGVGPKPPFDPLKQLIAHLKVKYGGFHRDHMQKIQDFIWQRKNTPKTIHTQLAHFAVAFGGVFTES